MPTTYTLTLTREQMTLLDFALKTARAVARPHAPRITELLKVLTTAMLHPDEETS